MNLIDYIIGVYEKNRYPINFPPKIELPKELAKAWHLLYTKGEAEGRESGQNLSIDLTQKKILSSVITPGTPVSCDIPRSGDLLEFGDVHSHPSASIGHIGGYSAHSVEDWRVFKYHLTKPIFIRFVSSGDFIYAVAYRKDFSHYDDKSINSRLMQHADYMSELFNFHNPPENKSSNQVEDLDYEEENRKIIEKKKKTKGFGLRLMEKSLENNAFLATWLKFGFYQGDKTKKVLTLIAGEKGIQS